MIKIKWAELHTPLFLADANLGQKLDPHKRPALKMEYNRPERELLVTYTHGTKTETAIIPTTNVVCMIEGEIAQRPQVEPVKPITAKITAQVETPQSHVFAGVGAGKTGK